MSSPAASQELDLDAVLRELGQFGRYQLRNYAFIMLPIIFSAVYVSQYVFTAGATDHRCVVPECEAPPLEFRPGGWEVWALAEGRRCERMVPLAPRCEPAAFSVSETQSCDAWVYEHNHTIVSTFGLACQEWRRTLVGTVHSLGLLAALPLTGYVSDNFGRRTAFIMTSVLAGAMGLIRSFSPSYTMYMVFEFLDATLGSGVYSTGFILALEWVGLERRVIGGNIVSSSFAVGQVLLALVAWGVPDWRNLTRVLYAPSLLFILYIFCIEESVRWLLSRGYKEEAAAIIFKAAKVNKKKLSPETIQKLSETKPVEQIPNGHLKPEDGGAKEPSIGMQILRSRIILTRVAICSFWWITTTFIYYGLSINSVSLAGNMYVNYILTALVEIPGYAVSVLTLDRFGRKRSIMASFTVCGVALVVLPFIPTDLQWLSTSLTLLGKLCISMVFSSIYIYTSELFPTSARHRLLATCSMVGRIGSIVAPQTPLLMEIFDALPYLIFGVMAVLAALLMSLTPETLNKKLPDTVAEAEGIAPPAPAPPAPAHPAPPAPAQLEAGAQ